MKEIKCLVCGKVIDKEIMCITDTVELLDGTIVKSSNFCSFECCNNRPEEE